MEIQDIRELLSEQRKFFNSGATRDLSFRLTQLQTLKEAMKAHEAEIFAALKADLNKSDVESYVSEVALVYEELNLIRKHLKQWMRPLRAGTPLIYAIAKSRVYHEPLGIVLIISPWNYPFQLLVAPLVGAIAAGNCAILKPSEVASNTSAIVAKMIRSCFAPEFVSVIEGGAETSEALLGEKFDHIFFTGGNKVAQIVMAAAARHLTPVTLELGGKSPCIVDDNTDLMKTARRLTWGKYFNAGQTCIAPDYLLVQKSVKNDLLQCISQSLIEFFGSEPLESPDYGRIINKRHFDRLTSLLEDGKPVIGGKVQSESLYIAPTVLTDVREDSKAMEEEIFGPILPVLEYDDLSQAIRAVNARPKPLALYFFSRDRQKQKRILRETSFGGGCINDTLIHMSNPNLPFGGVGGSGIGSYHGKNSFEVFSHRKAVVHQSFLLDLKLRYPPYKNRLGLFRRLMG